MKRLALYVLIIAVTVAALILLWQFRSVLILLLLSLMLAAALRPSADYLTSRGLSVSLSWLLVYLGLFLVVGLTLFFLGGPLLDELRLLSNYLVILYDFTYQQWDNSDSGVAQAIIQRLPPPDQLPEVMAGPSGLSILRVVFGVGQNVVALVAALVIIIVLSLYWSTDRAHFERLWLSLLPAGKRIQARSIWQTTEASVGDYLRSELVQAVLAIGLLAVSYRLLGLDYPILAALLAGLAWLIPMAGFVFAAGVAFLAGLASASGFQTALLALVITAAVLAFLEFVVEPRFFRRDQFSGLLIVLVVLLLVEAYGLVGFVIAPPLAVALQIVGSHVIRLMQRPPSALPQIDALEKRLDVVHATYNGQQAMGEPPAPEIGSLLDRLEGLVEQTRRVAD
ncbi:MAG: AI-2E family transporter [Candidatus Promineofilum sp.]|jgi:predicted PurR-regulated permease PerM|nr:AI-2E family transporter [Promineifilum sp.]